jgi:hypothetical protein
MIGLTKVEPPAVMLIEPAGGTYGAAVAVDTDVAVETEVAVDTDVAVETEVAVDTDVAVETEVTVETEVAVFVRVFVRVLVRVLVCVFVCVTVADSVTVVLPPPVVAMYAPAAITTMTRTIAKPQVAVLTPDLEYFIFDARPAHT